VTYSNDFLDMKIKKTIILICKISKKVRSTGFEPATVGFGVQRSTVGATTSYDTPFAKE
jgi:hypothetical protein